MPLIHLRGFVKNEQKIMPAGWSTGFWLLRAPIYSLSYKAEEALDLHPGSRFLLLMRLH